MSDIGELITGAIVAIFGIFIIIVLAEALGPVIGQLNFGFALLFYAMVGFIVVGIVLGVIASARR